MRTPAFANQIRAGIGASALVLMTNSFATSPPGGGVIVQWLKNPIADETFQTPLVMKALERLGHDAQPVKEIEHTAGEMAIGNDDAAFLEDHWDSLHIDFFAKARGGDKLCREGIYSPGASLGSQIDKETAGAYGMTNIGQLKAAGIAKLFFANGGAKADSTGYAPGSSCDKVTKHRLDAYGLRDTVALDQGSYSAIIADTIARHDPEQSVLYSTWTPYRVSGALVPGKAAIWLHASFSSLPDVRAAINTALPHGCNYDIPANTQQIVANRACTDARPDVANMSAIMKVRDSDINARNLRMDDGEGTAKHIECHADACKAVNQAKFDGTIAKSLAAANRGQPVVLGWRSTSPLAYIDV